MKDNFIHVKNMWKEQLCKLKVGDFCYGSPGPKTFRDLRETGPSSYMKLSTMWQMWAFLGYAEGNHNFENRNFNNFLAFAQAAFDAKFGAILAEKILSAISQHLSVKSVWNHLSVKSSMAIFSGARGESRVTCGASIKHAQRSLLMRGSLKATFM